MATKPVPTSEEELASRELRVVSVVSLRAVSPFSFFLPPVRGRSSNLARSGLSLQLLRLLTFTFRRPLQRALQRQLASSSPPSRLSLTTLAPSLLHCTPPTALPATTTVTGKSKKCKERRRAPHGRCIGVEMLSRVLRVTADSSHCHFQSFSSPCTSLQAQLFLRLYLF